MKKAERKLLTSWDFWGLGTGERKLLNALQFFFFVFPSRRRRRKFKAKENWKWDKFVDFGSVCEWWSGLSAFGGSFSEGYLFQSTINITSDFATFTFKQAWRHHRTSRLSQSAANVEPRLDVLRSMNVELDYEFHRTSTHSKIKSTQVWASFLSPPSFPCRPASETLFAFVIYISCQPCQWKWKMALISEHRQFSIYSGGTWSGDLFGSG